MLQQLFIRHVRAVDGIDITAGANVDANVLSLLSREAIEYPIVEVNKERQQVAGRPRIARVVARRQAAFGKVHDDVCSAGVKARANVFFAFADNIFLKLLARIARYVAVKLKSRYIIDGAITA
jgi:hypothetical protein